VEQMRDNKDNPAYKKLNEIQDRMVKVGKKDKS